MKHRAEHCRGLIYQARHCGSDKSDPYKTLVFLFTVYCLLFTVFTACTRHEEASAKTENTKAYKINISMDNEKRIQETFENGSQLWRKNSKDVAHAALINEGVNVKIEDCNVLSEDEKEAIVSAKDKKGSPYKVICKKLFKPDGIWTAVEIDMEGTTNSK